MTCQRFWGRSVSTGAPCAPRVCCWPPVWEPQGPMLVLPPPPAEFGILMTLLRSEDEVVVGNAALCLGNCMEVPGAAPSLLKTDVVQVLLRHAGGDAQKTAVQLNAGIALGKLCTAEPRYAAAPGQVACVGHVAEGTGPTKTLDGGWAYVPPRTPEGVVGALELPEHAGVGPVAASLRGQGGSQLQPERENASLTGLCSTCSWPLSSLQPTPSCSASFSPLLPHTLLLHIFAWGLSIWENVQGG